MLALAFHPSWPRFVLLEPSPRLAVGFERVYHQPIVVSDDPRITSLLDFHGLRSCRCFMVKEGNKALL
jgi:hypothetical protein